MSISRSFWPSCTSASPMLASPCGWYFIVLPDDVRHLVVAPVVEFLHAVQDPALHGLEAIVQVRHRTFEDHVAGVIQEPFAVHAAHAEGAGLACAGDTFGCFASVRGDLLALFRVQVVVQFVTHRFHRRVAEGNVFKGSPWCSTGMLWSLRTAPRADSRSSRKRRAPHGGMRDLPRAGTRSSSQRPGPCSPR